MWHDDQRRKTFQCWSDMKQRCCNPKSPQFKNYGARGITVCSRWINSFAFFVEDMGLKPEGLTLDRINNDGNYEPGNCRWATKREQNSNRRGLRLICFRGSVKNNTEWAEELGIHPTTLNSRRALGLPLEEIMTRGSRKTKSAMKQP